MNSHHSAQSSLILLGPGERLKRLSDVLQALVRGERARVETLDDHEQLLNGHGPTGRLVLDSDELPVEEIGFVRRFLKRHPEWQLALLGERTPPRESGALVHRRGTQWLPWPPTWDELEALGGPVHGGTPDGGSAPGVDAEPTGARGLEDADSPERRSGSAEALAAPLSAIAQRSRLALHALRREVGDGAADALDALEAEADRLEQLVGAPPDRVLDLRGALEELVTSALVGSSAPRYRFRPSEGDLAVCADAELLTEGLRRLLGLARACGDRGSVIELRADGRAGPEEPVALRLDFPAGPLAGEPSERLLERELLEARLAPEDAAAAAGAAELLEAAGVTWEVAGDRGDRVRVRLRVPRFRGASAAPGDEPDAADGRPGDEDVAGPFDRD